MQSENSKTKTDATAFLGGQTLLFEEANKLWKQLKGDDDISLSRKVLERLRSGEGLKDRIPAQGNVRNRLCREEALLTSKDPELNVAMRHDLALRILLERFDLGDPALDGDAETLGIAGGICKRRWNDLGQMDDLIRAGNFYGRAAKGDLGEDAYPHINAAFIEDLLAHMGIDEQRNRANAEALRQQIVADLPVTGSLWNTATRVEAFFGLRKYDDATQALSKATQKPEPWELQTTVQQLSTLARLHEAKPLEVPQIRAFFEALLPNAADSVRSAIAGKVGIALSGGGFRASFYHLGVLARLAELDVLRKVEVLSCVSGGSIVGAAYWLALRRRLMDPRPLFREDYVELIQELIRSFEASVAADLRGSAQPSKVRLLWRMVRGAKGLLDPEVIAQKLEDTFYRPMVQGNGTLFMHDLPFTPADHNPAVAGSTEFHPGKHNWLRNHKVPVLVINATTVNTAHAWQFTPTWMGESPWAVHESADSIPRLQWSWYQSKAEPTWQIALGRAVAASAGVPGVVAPLRMDDAYEGMKIQLVDGGVHDNQGTVSLLALNCNVLIVSDACGQLLLEESPSEGLPGQLSYAGRSMGILMERIRLANFEHLSSRKLSGLVRGLMFLHMKAGLDADPRRLRFSQESFVVRRAPLSPSGVRKDFQQALAELRTDIDAFTQNEGRALMACGYKMASSSFDENLRNLTELWDAPPPDIAWPFEDLLKEITSVEAATPGRASLLDELRKGSKITI